MPALKLPLCLLSILAVLPIADVVHLVARPHAVCAEHGGAIEVAAAPEAAPASRAAALSVARSARGGDGHHHCAALSGRVARGGSPALGFALALPQRAAPAMRACLAAPLPIPLLFFAPKGSPPPR